MPGSDDDLPSTARTLGRLAAVVAAPACITAISEPVPWIDLVPSLAECGNILADHGCQLAVEFTPYSALGTLAEAIPLCDAVGQDRCGLVLDPVHFFRSGALWETLAEVTATQIAVVPWNDARADAIASTPVALAQESLTRRLQPGDGDLALVDLAAAIKATGWDGAVSAEILSDDLRRCA